MTLLTDREIQALAENDIFFPFVGEKQRQLENGTKALSFGLSHAGYDLRLSPIDFRIIDNTRATNTIVLRSKADILDVKAFDETVLTKAVLKKENGSSFFVLPALSYGLGVSLERISMPEDVMGICDGKSTYARQGTIINVTPIEPGWCGHLTICIVNPCTFPVRIYANEGIVQVMLLRLNDKVNKAYGDGKYQNQSASVQLAAV